MALFDVEDAEAERVGTGGITVILECPLLELAKEVMRPSSLVIVTETHAGPRSLESIGKRHAWKKDPSHSLSARYRYGRHVSQAR